jgi:hypothetical protein
VAHHQDRAVTDDGCTGPCRCRGHRRRVRDRLEKAVRVERNADKLARVLQTAVQVEPSSATNVQLSRSVLRPAVGRTDSVARSEPDRRCGSPSRPATEVDSAESGKVIAECHRQRDRATRSPLGAQTSHVVERPLHRVPSGNLENRSTSGSPNCEANTARPNPAKHAAQVGRRAKSTAEGGRPSHPHCAAPPARSPDMA